MPFLNELTISNGTRHSVEVEDVLRVACVFTSKIAGETTQNGP